MIQRCRLPVSDAVPRRPLQVVRLKPPPDHARTAPEPNRQWLTRVVRTPRIMGTLASPGRLCGTMRI